jgi:quinol monooxygenase YgiN
MIIVTGSFIAKEGHFDEALAVSLEHVRRSRLENGCLSHSVQQDVENPLRLVFFEEWADRAALTAHFALPASRAFVKAVTKLAIEAPEISVFEAEIINI